MKKSFFLPFALSALTQFTNAQSLPNGTPGGLQNPETRLVRNFNSSWVNMLVKTQLMGSAFTEKIALLHTLETNSGQTASLDIDNFETEADWKQSEEIINQAAGYIEKYDFESAHKLLGRHIKTNPGNDAARYLLGLTQLSRGLYGPAASNFSKINYRLAQSGIAGLDEFRDDVRFYYAISVTMIPGGKSIAKVLFKQLDHEGSAYKSICREMAELL